MIDKIMGIEIINSLKLSKTGVDWIDMMVEESNKGISSNIL